MKFSVFLFPLSSLVSPSNPHNFIVTHYSFMIDTCVRKVWGMLIISLLRLFFPSMPIRNRISISNPSSDSETAWLPDCLPLITLTAEQINVVADGFHRPIQPSTYRPAMSWCHNIPRHRYHREKKDGINEKMKEWRKKGHGRWMHLSVKPDWR